MNPSRRRFAAVLLGLVCIPLTRAAGSAVASGDETSQAWRDTLAQGAQNAMARLGRENGYFGDARTRIGLPKNFAKAERYLRAIGLGRRVDDLVLAMNRAAEAALPRARDRVLAAVRELPPLDAAGNATAWFRQHTEARLSVDMAPIIHAVAGQSDLVRSYDALSSKLVKLAGIRSELVTVEDYVNHGTLEGLYLMMAEEEHARLASPTAGGAVGKAPGTVKSARIS